MNGDSRFFDGYVWVSDQPDCMLGLCFKGDERSAAEQFTQKGYWRKESFAYTKTQPYDVPMRHVLNGGAR